MADLKTLFKIINAQKRTNSRDNIVGAAREKIAEQVLQNMKEKGEIRDFLKTSNGTTIGWADLIRGVDFYVIKINARYRVFAISVTGPGWLENHIKSHPENHHVAIDLRDKDVFCSTRDQFRKIFTNDSAH